MKSARPTPSSPRNWQASRRYRKPVEIQGIKATMIRALKITAESIALLGVARCMILSAFNCGYVVANAAGMMAKYFARSLAIENVVFAPPLRLSRCSAGVMEVRVSQLPPLRRPQASGKLWK